MKNKNRYVIYAFMVATLLYIFLNLIANDHIPLSSNTKTTNKVVNDTTFSIHGKDAPANRSGNLNPSEKRIITITGGTIQLNGAILEIPPAALKKRKEISITALNKKDLPILDEGLVNVTPNQGGYRFLPHGSIFEKEVKIFMPYDESLVPAGYSSEDILTYFFDETEKSWVPLKRDYINDESALVISLTSHFTDMINGIIKVPESQQTHNYTPTTIKNMEAADPSKAITVIEAPVATSFGNLVLSYPLKLPVGRKGMQPELSINYNSEGSNGWLGIGWNLMTPSITIDTRWGAPRYSNVIETETYLLNGDQLSPVAHRSDLVNRSAEKQFFPRAENDFKKIIRHGNNPANYWWEVTEKNGKRYFYGGHPNSGVDQASVLTDASGNIAHWALKETRDLNNNFVSYQYKKIIDAGISGGTVPGYQLYINKISYTGYGNEEGKYSVIFKTSRDLTEPKRKDVIINARLGFKQVTSDLLRKIEIQFNGANIRSYELKYQEGAFYKTLLDDIIEFDASGKEFYRHHLGYYDNVRSEGIYHPFEAQQNWQTPNDDIHGNFLNPIQHFGDNVSALGGNKSSGGGGGLTLTAGVFDGRLFNKSNTAGASFGFSKSKNEGMLQLVDINGDGLPDKVFKKNGTLFYRPNESGPDGQLRFGDIRPITGITDFDKGSATTIEGGIESNFVIYAGLQFSQTKNERSVYFADVNGDMLMDIVKDGIVFFNRLDTGGNPVFTPLSSGTPSPIHSLGGVDQSLVSIDSAELQQLENDNPLHDAVKIWKAPYDGVISITNPVQLVEDTSDERQSYPSADGVKVTIQHKDTELWNTIIQEDDYTAKNPVGLDSINVVRGDQIYFRVQSIYNGAYDQVNWEPVITYRNHIPGLNDANGFPVYQFNASTDFLATVPMSVGMTFKGVVQIKGFFEKPQTSDDIEITVVKKRSGVEHILWQQQFAWDSIVAETISLSDSVIKEDEFYFRVHSSTNIEWKAVKWSPRVYYISSDDPEIPTVINTNGDPIFNFYPVVDYSIYNKIIRPFETWVATQHDTLSIVPKLQLSLPNSLTGTISFSIKKEKELLAKEIINVMSGTISGDDTLHVIVKAGDSLFLEYHTRNASLWNAFTLADAKIFGHDTTDITPGVQVFSEEKHQFGTMYRHWGQFIYNGNGNRGLNPINETELVIASSISNPDSIDLSGAGNEQEMQDTYNNHNGNTPSKDNFVYMVPSAIEPAWKGYDELTYVTHNILSSSRMGEDDLLPINPLSGFSGSGSGAKAIKKISRTRNVSVSAGFVVNGSFSSGKTNQLYDYMDMNGDRYPDLLSKNKIQYTLPIGGLDSIAKNFVFGEIDQSNHYTIGLTKGGTFLTSGQFNSRAKNRGRKSSEAGADAQASASISGNFNVNYDSTFFAWLDINGDGLADRVNKNGNVELNLGYSFAAAEQWGISAICEGNTIGYGGGIGINIGNYSIAAGIGLSRSENNMNKALRDINGDGLPDFIVDQPIGIISNSDPLMVAINTGNGFAAPITWMGATAINEDISTGESANGAFCVCIPITPLTPVAKICFNPSVELSHGVSREKISILDIDGDDYPDFLESEKDDELKIKRSAIGITNLLRSVSRPMSAGFVINYKRSGNSYGMPNSIWTLADVKIFDGVAGDGADTMLTSFEYSNGFYNRNERESYGFKTVKIREHDTQNGGMVYRTTVKEFINDNFYEKGLQVSEVLLDSAGKKFRETTYKYELKNIHTGSPLPPGFENSDAGEAYPALTETKMLFYEGLAVATKSTRMNYNYDVLGNLISYTDFGDTDPTDDYTTQITYHSVAAKYLMNIPKSVLVSGGGQIFRKQEQDINIQNGDITEIRNFSEPGIASTTNLEYDGFGNLKVITRPKNETNQRLSYSYQYDPEVNTYITRVSDSYGYFSSLAYDLRFGLVLSVTDLNNQKTIYAIDDAGRITTVTGPMEAAAGIPFTISFQYHPDAIVPWALTRHYDPEHPNNFIETVTFMDGLMRPIQLKKDGAIFTSPGNADKEMMLVSGANIYDAFGRIVEIFYPITEEKGNEGIYNNTRDIVSPTKMIFDVLDREIKKILPDGAFSTNKFGFGTDRNGVVQLSKLFSDANGVKKEEFVDIRGRITSTKNYFLQQQDIWTSFIYNAINELTAVKDHEQNIITSEYDWLGRRIKLNHPDAGLTTQQYNPAGMVIKKVTANLQGSSKAIIYRHDLERLSQVIYPDNPQNNVKYNYGSMDAPFNRAGRIAVQEDATGALEFFYNPLGDIVKNIRTILVPLHGTRTYKTEWVYDTWNRVQSMVYPDGEVLQYNYNIGGQLLSIHGVKAGTTNHYATQIGYDKFEQKVYLKYGNSTETFYNYEPQRRRLKQLIAETANNRKMMNTTYVYDKENNILDLDNAADIPPSNLMGGSSKYHFIYDDLYRLTNAKGNFKGSNHEQRFEISMQYNSVGNIIQKDQVHDKKANNSQNWVAQNGTTYSSKYDYAPGKPHAPMKIGKRSYSYDANGNQKGWTQNPGVQQRTINWDEENRIKAITDNGALFSYTYDADGERVLKNNGGNAQVKINGQAAGGNTGIGNYTIYLNQYVVIKSGNYTNHYYAEDMRMASRVDESKNLLAANIPAGKSANVAINYDLKEEQSRRAISKLYDDADIDLPVTNTKTGKDLEQNNLKVTAGSVPAQQSAGGNANNPKSFIYFYHPDHVGNTAYVTDASGEVYQHIEYFPFGETFIEEHSNTHRTPYLYNAKELDEETGLYYYGARYYDSKTQVWQSTDPISEDYPAWSPYHYTFLSPVNYSDPDGREADKFVEKIPGKFVKAAVRYYESFTRDITWSFDEQPNRVFWSGGQAWKQIKQKAFEYAQANESITLEMTTEGIELEGVAGKFPFEVTENLWKQVSIAYGKGAKGNVAAILYEVLREGNIYMANERPKLIKNEKKSFKEFILKGPAEGDKFEVVEKKDSENN